MGTRFLILVLALYIVCPVFNLASRISIEGNGYENILVSLPEIADAKFRDKIVSSIKDLFLASSPLLLAATKGKAHFRSVTFLAPQAWGESWMPQQGAFEDAGAAWSRSQADVVVTHSGDDHPYTLHQGGCGRQAVRIYLPDGFLLTGNLRQKGREFVRLWSEFRYGVFPEAGFEDDPKYPTIYQIPGDDSNRTTGCNAELNSISRQCKENEVCSDGPPKSSLMDQHLPSSAILFCENYLNLGPRHDPISPSKHNLLCNEEGTWFTVLRSPDFKHGRNAAPKNLSVPEVEFRFVRELVSPSVVVAIDVSSQMKKENRYHLTKTAFSQFVTSRLPDGGELTAVLFGGGPGSRVVTPSVRLPDREARVAYLESLPLPDEPLEGDAACVDCVLADIIELVTNKSNTFKSAPFIVIVTAENNLNHKKFDDIVRKLQNTEIALAAMTFADEINRNSNTQTSLYELCLKTGNKFFNLEGDLFKNLYHGFHEAITLPRSGILIFQEYLSTLDEENLKLSFVIDESVSQVLEVSISGPSFGTSSTLEYEKTLLVGPDSNLIQPRKVEIVPSLSFQAQNPKPGRYVLKTRRKNRAASPVLVSVYGTPIANEDVINVRVWMEETNSKPGRYVLKTRRKNRATSPVLVSVYGTPITNEDVISVRVWVEETNSKISPPPVQIFAEIRKGPYPIKNVSVFAYVQHPNYHVENVSLFDDGLGSVDITYGDGIFSHYFSNFSGIGFYNVNVKVTGGFEDDSIISRGPQSHCCGSVFPGSVESSSGQFQREAGPVTFRVTTVHNESDQYPPARVTDLRVARAFEQIIVLQWSAVGSDFDTGEAAAYELKLFRDRSTIRNRFPDSSLLTEVIPLTTPAPYGTNLYHFLQIPNSLEKGLYYFGIRGLDDAGNAGEPSNAVAVWIGTRNKSSVDCTDEPVSERLGGSASSLSSLASIFMFTLSFFVTFRDLWWLI